MLGGAGSPGGDELLTVTVVRDEHGYGMKVSGDNPVYVQSVKEHGAAWRAGLRSGDRILRVDNVAVHHHTHQQVVHMIRANPTTVLTVQQNTSRLKTPITAPVPVNSEKQRQLEVSKVQTMRLMLEEEQNYIKDLRNELSKVPDVRKQQKLEAAESRCSHLQHEIDTITAAQPGAPFLAALISSSRGKHASSPPPNNSTGFLSGLPRSLSNLTGQSLRSIRQARQNNAKTQQENQPPLVRQNSDESNNKRRHVHNNTVPMVPTTCLDNVTPPPLPPRTERPKRNPLSPTLSPPLNPLAKPKPCSSASPIHNQYYKGRYYPDKFPMHQSMPGYDQKKLRKSSHSLDGELDGPQPNSIAMQMSYPLVNAPPPPLQTDNRGNVPVLHVRSQSSPEHLDHDMMRSTSLSKEREAAPRATPPPGTPPPPYAHNTQPCADPQRAIISMEEDDSPASDNSIYSGLFSNLRSVRESKARTAVLINWLLGERRCACASLLLVITDGYRAAAAPAATLRRWAYEIQSTFLMPHAVLQLNGVDENMANEIEHVLVNEYEKEELLRNVFRKARQKAKEELSQQLTEFQVKRQLGLGALYGPEDSLIEKCDVDKAQEVVVVERLLCARLSSLSALRAGGCASSPGPPSADAHHALLAALVAAALTLHARPAAVAAAAGGSRASFLQRDKTYKQRTKQLAKQHPQPFIVRGHHLQLQAMTSVGHCHHCDNVIWGLAPQAYVCTDCKLRVHGRCARAVEEGCVGGDDSHNNRISRLIDRIQPHAYQDSSEKKSRKSSGASHFLNMERSFRKMEDEQPWDQTLTPATAQGEPRREGSTDEPTPPEADADHSDSVTKETQDKETHSWRSPSATATRGVNRAESCRERDAPRRGKHRNASDPNRLTAHNNHDLEPGAATAPSGSSSSSSLSSRSNESNTATIGADQQASQSDWSEEDEPLAAQWADSLPSHVLDSLLLSSRLRKRQEVIHELIVSEGSHVRWLKVLGGVFLRPLEAQTSLLPAEELRALFPNLPAVREKHAKLYAELRQVRADADNHVVRIRPVADAMLATLGEAGYASCLSRFCRGQRMSLEALRERRRKSKELHQFLAAREQLPLCGRLQLRDLLACVWQRLTKYQLLLESILKTVSDNEAESEADGETEEDIHRLKRALDTAKDVLQSVDHAIRTAENEHRLRTIQSKLEVRISIVGAEWEEARRLDLTARRLRMEADLSIRNDNKKINVLALMLEDCLVLLQREGDKFVLKPIAQPSQQSHLSPLIKWDKVLFRPNAAVRNTFFLMNINGVQMHELSANTNNEYSTWVKHIQELPLAKPELKPSLTPSHQASRSTDDSGINVSRNPSDASEKSNSLAGEDESERDRASTERSSAERERETEDKRSVDREERRSEDKEEAPEREEKHKPRRPTVGRISTHVSLSPAPLEAGALTVTAPAADTRAARAETAYTYQEHLRRLDESIARSLAAKSAIVSKLLGLPADSFAQMADLAVAETMGQIDVCGELGLPGTRAEEPAPEGAPDMHQLLLAAHAQANQLVESLSSALSVEEGAAVAARATRGRCDRCTRRRDTQKEDTTEPCPESAESPARGAGAGDRLEDDTFEALESVRGALVARRTAGLGAGVALAVGRALSALPAHLARAQLLRQEVAALRDDNDRLRDLLRQGYSTTEEIHFPKEGGDQTIQDQPSNGG